MKVKVASSLSIVLILPYGNNPNLINAWNPLQIPIINPSLFSSKSVIADFNFSFLKNVAASLGITEISERNDRLLLYVEGLTEPVSRLITSNLKKRVLFSAGTKPYLAVKPDANENMIEEHIVDNDNYECTSNPSYKLVYIPFDYSDEEWYDFYDMLYYW